jgi:hypothetical protein
VRFGFNISTSGHNITQQQLQPLHTNLIVKLLSFFGQLSIPLLDPDTLVEEQYVVQ